MTEGAGDTARSPAPAGRDHVVIVGASDLVMPVFRIAREELGLGVVALDGNPAAPGMAYADVALEVSTKDPEAAVAAVRDLARRVRVVGVFTAGADVEITVAAVAHALRLPGIDPDVARRCNDKLEMHRHLDARGFTAKPAWRLVDGAAACRAAAREVGLPCIVKPLDNCASRGIQRVDTEADLQAAYDLAVGFNGTRGGHILVEQHLAGTKHTVEMLAWRDRWHLLSIIDTHYISPRWPCETGLNTTTLPPARQAELFAFGERVARLVGIDFNAHKVDVNVGADGSVKLIELTARLSGGFHCQYASPIAHGSHDIRAALKLAVGRDLDPADIAHAHERGAAVRAVFPTPGRIVSIDGIEEARASPGVEQVFVWRRVGDRVGPYRNSADRPAFVIAGGATPAEASENAERGASLLRIQTVP